MEKTETKHNVNNVNNINNYDLYFSKLSINNQLQKQNYDSLNIKEDVIMYKKEIKNRMTKLLNKYLDVSNNFLENDFIYKKKHEKHFHYFLSSFIDEIKFAHIKKNVQNDLSYIEMSGNTTVTEDLSNHIFKLDMSMCKKPKKPSALNSLVKITSEEKEKILPKKIMGKKDKYI